MEEVKIRELPEKSNIGTTNHIVVEDEDGTKKVLVKYFRSLLLSSLFFNSVEELKNSTDTSLKEGDICETLGYHTPGDGGGAKYRITYNPAAVEDGKLVHYLSYSDTLRAEIILDDTINVHQFGAVGDGSADDTDAIQAAMDNSDSRTIEFSNNKRYAIRDTIEINKNNTVVNGNGGIIVPYYVTGFNVKPKYDTEPVITNINISNLHFDCSNATDAIFIFKASKVDITSCNVSNITNTGITVRNSEFVNISYASLQGKNTGSMITLDGDKPDRFINILNCNFVNFAKAINVMTTDIGDATTLINIDGSNYNSTATNSYCVYVANPIEMIAIYANTVTAANTFLYFGGASKGDISCRGISCLNTSKIFDIGTSQGVLHLDGSIKVSANAILFVNMNGKLRSNITWDLLPKGANFTNKPIGELYDAIYPYNYMDNRGYTISGSKLTLNEARNMHVDWSNSTNNINEIINGVKGQLMYIKSSTGKSIIAVDNKIVLSDSSVKLGKFKGILLRFDGLKWVQIQYIDSTIVETVAAELLIDYSEIEFDTNKIVGDITTS